MEFDVGSFDAPGDLKAWFKGLDKGLKKAYGPAFNGRLAELTSAGPKTPKAVTAPKPCPGCSWVEIRLHVSHDDFIQAHCPNCHMLGPRGTSRGDATRKWNALIRKQEN